MSKIFSVFGRTPPVAIDASGISYEILLLKKIPRSQGDAEIMPLVEHEWVYSTIVIADTPTLAAYEALYEYFVWRLAGKWQPRKRRLTQRELTLIDLSSKDLAESVLRRRDTPSGVIRIFATPWEPSCITLHFKAPR